MVISRAIRRALALLAGSCLVCSACGAAHYYDALNQRTATVSQTAFAVDPGVLGSLTTPGTSPLNGMRGAAPAITIDADFRSQILAVDPGVRQLSGAAEGYDAVVLIALGAEQARDDAPGRIADRLVGLTQTGKQCTDFRSCRRLIETKLDPDYFGRSGGISLQPNGDPAEAGFGTIEFTTSGNVRTGDVTPAQAPPSQAPAPLVDLNAPPAGNGTLRIGFLLPPAGPEGDTARAAQAGANAAVAEINGAGGVLGEPIQVVADETGDGSSGAVNTAVDHLISGQVDAVIGGTNFEIDRVAVPRLTAAGILTISPTDTNRALSILPDRGLFFRLAPPEDLEGQVLGTLVANDGYTRAAVVTSGAGDDLETANDVGAAIGAAGGKVVATVTATGTDAASAGRAAQAVIDSGAQAVVITTPVTLAAPIIKALVERGKGPSAFGVYGTTSNMTKELVTLVAAK